MNVLIWVMFYLKQVILIYKWFKLVEGFESLVKCIFKPHNRLIILFKNVHYYYHDQVFIHI